MSIESDIVWSRRGVLRGSDYGDYYGGAVGISDDGTRLIVGGRLGDEVLNNAGYVKIYERNGNDWKQLGDALHGDIASEQFGTAVAISGDGSTVAVGSPWSDTFGTESGDVRFYKYTFNSVTATWSWTLFANVLSGAQPYDRFGSSVSLNYDGSKFIGGSPRADTGGVDAGNVRMYSNDGGAWILMGAMSRGDGIGYKAGVSVSMNGDGDNVIFGSPYHSTTGGVVTGSARVLQWSDESQSWSAKGTTLEGRHEDDAFGMTVSIDEMGDTVAVGAPGVSQSVTYTGDAANRGYVDVYRWTMTSWQVFEWELIGHLTGGEAEKEYFGLSVSLNKYGDYVAVGAPELTVNAQANVGGVTVFHRADNVWSQYGDVLSGKNSNGYFGLSVRMSGSGQTVMVGCPGNYGESATSGSMTVYEVVTPSSKTNKLVLDEILGITNLTMLVLLLLCSVYAYFTTMKQQKRSRIVYETSEAIADNNRRENINMAF